MSIINIMLQIKIFYNNKYYQGIFGIYPVKNNIPSRADEVEETSKIIVSVHLLFLRYPFTYVQKQVQEKSLINIINKDINLNISLNYLSCFRLKSCLLILITL